MVIEMVVEGPVVKGTLFERFTNEKTGAEGVVAESTVNKKLEVDSHLIKLLGVEDI